MTANISNLKAEARRRARAQQADAKAARAERDRANLKDVSAYIVAVSQLKEVDDWEAKRLKEVTAQVRAEARKRRAGRRAKAGAALALVKRRGETQTTIAAMTGHSVGEIRAMSRYAPNADTSAPGVDSHALGGGDQGGSETAPGTAAGDQAPPTTASAT